jgi:tricorn protease
VTRPAAAPRRIVPIGRRLAGRTPPRSTTRRLRLSATLLGLALAWGATAVLASAGSAVGDASSPLLLRKPALGPDSICFAYGGDLWLVGREGGAARRLTSGSGEETDPAFSPDGSLIAFTGEYGGKRDVYVVPSEGGLPRRLTHHPDDDEVVGWTSDGARILFRSSRASVAPRYHRLFTVPKEGGFPSPVDLPSGYDGAFSPDGERLAYMPTSPAFAVWKRYRGGQTTSIAIASLKDARLEAIPRDNSNDVRPMWVGGTIYFLSDREGPVTLFAYDTQSRQVRRALANDGLDLKSASAGPGGIVYEQFGSLFFYDTAKGAARRLAISVAADLPQVRARYVPVDDQILGAALSPTGARAVFEARGEILTVPAEKGNVRDISATTGAAERDPAWSPDGKSIAYLSDEDGEYALFLRDQSGLGAPRKFALGDSPAFYYSPIFSPDGGRIAYLDNRLSLWVLDLDTGKNLRIATDAYETPWRTLDPSWSPDSRFVTYTRLLPNHLRAVFAYDLETRKELPITDGLSDARYPVFDRDGKNLYFTASVDAGPAAPWLDLSSYGHTVTRSVYVAVLRRDLPSPLSPQSDEETGAGAPGGPSKGGKEKGGKGKPARDKKAGEDTTGTPPAEPVRVDVDGLPQRILALPIAARPFSGLFVTAPGTLVLLETIREPAITPDEPEHTHQTVHRFDLEKRTLEPVVELVSGFGDDADEENWRSTVRVSADGESMLYKRDDAWFITGTDSKAGADLTPLHTDEMQVLSDPRAEWRQMFREVWRIERDFFYDPHYHGLDLAAAERKYASYLDRLASRADLNDLFEEMLGELTVGHLFVRGGDLPHVDQPKPGLLGADYDLHGGRYRFARIYGGENWNPALRAPLTQPGIDVRQGDYLLAVNGRPLTAADEVYAFFQATAGKSVVLRVGPKADGGDARDVSVVPVASEAGLRNLAWIEGNRRTVDKLSGGRLAYVWLPDTADRGYANFNRYYFAQVDREGAIVDERNNGGGYIADYIIDVLKRTLTSRWTTRTGADFSSPLGSILGPKAMIINQYAGSGGDFMPWSFKQAKIGPLVGKRTWGGLVGIYDYPVLMDGGTVTAPRVAFYDLEGQWDVENHGVDPDIDVDLDPAAWRAGHDTQLEAAIKAVMDRLPPRPAPMPARPAYPNYHSGPVKPGT